MFEDFKNEIGEVRLLIIAFCKPTTVDRNDKRKGIYQYPHGGHWFNPSHHLEIMQGELSWLA